MRSGLRLLLLASCFIVSPTGPSIAVQGGDSMLYELREGSFLLDGCLSCDRADISRPLHGTFRLTQSYVGNVVVGFDVAEVQLETVDGRELVFSRVFLKIG